MNNRGRGELIKAGFRSGRSVFTELGMQGLGVACLKVLVPALAFIGVLGAQSRNFDARTDLNAQINFPPTPEQSQALNALGDSTGDLSASFERTTGATRSLWNRGGFLTDVDSTSSVNDIAAGFLAEHATALGLTDDDLSGYEVTDSVFSQVTGATHLYLRQTHLGLPVYNGQLQFNVNRDGRILSVNNAFLPDVATGGAGPQPSVTSVEAAESASEHLGLNSSLEPLNAELMWLGVRRGQTRLVWNFQLDISHDHYYDFTVDAQSGQVWTRIDWVADATYTVYAQPVESPNHGGRTPETDPADWTASPWGWHDDDGAEGEEYTVLDGNNVHAYHHLNFFTGVNTDCGVSLSCDFPVDLSLEPHTYTDAASTNLFYWNNIIHDIQYHYGFDEAAGNFQTNNYGNGGADNDHVHAESQDYAGNCNANFRTPPDGSIPRMQMYLCNLASPMRDGDFDNAVIVHEYGHGISNRQVGGPSHVSCLGNEQQPGEGWSDWFGLAYTAESHHAGADARGMGTYLFGQGATGGGIRPAPYSTAMAVNNYMYADISGLAAPHGVGFVWATIAWEAYWELVNFHGFSTNLYNAAGGAGNQRMMLYVNEGLKNTACSPTFLDARDGIIQAAVDNHGGEDVCRLWDAFARRGLGSDASTTGSNSSATNGINLPVQCTAACASPPAEDCSDGVDNDCDFKVDCADVDDCGNLAPEAVCDDGIDNDCDLNVDCDDADCAGDLACLCIVQNASCSADTDCCSNKCRGGRCKGSGGSSCTLSAATEVNCSDGVDDDCNTFIDCADDACADDLACLDAPGCTAEGASCAEDPDCCSNNCSRGKPSTRECLAASGFGRSNQSLLRREEYEQLVASADLEPMSRPARR